MSYTASALLILFGIGPLAVNLLRGDPLGIALSLALTVALLLWSRRHGARQRRLRELGEQRDHEAEAAVRAVERLRREAAEARRRAAEAEKRDQP
jgi:hypothetical protein